MDPPPVGVDEHYRAVGMVPDIVCHGFDRLPRHLPEHIAPKNNITNNLFIPHCNAKCKVRIPPYLYGIPTVIDYSKSTTITVF